MLTHPRVRAAIIFLWVGVFVATMASPTAFVSALGKNSNLSIAGILVGPEPSPTTRRRLAWEVRKRTSIETQSRGPLLRLTDKRIFGLPFLYWSGNKAFEPLSMAEIVALRRYVAMGGFVLIDDAAPESKEFDSAVRRALKRAFPTQALFAVPKSHTIFRSFYLVPRPVGRVRGPEKVWAIERAGSGRAGVASRLAIVYTRHHIGGAWARDDLGTWSYSVVPAGDSQREAAIRFGVNLVMYALCLDYKDDQVHAPYIMRRRGLAPAR